MSPEAENTDVCQGRSGHKDRYVLFPTSFRGELAQYVDLNCIGLVGEYDVAPDGSATNKNWEWK